MSEPVDVHTTDGARLSVTTFGSAGEARAGVLIVPAMGVAQPYYTDFATWLAARGLFVVTFDYRGIGLSRGEGSLRHERADVRTWAERDAAAVVDFAAERLGDKPLLWIGHSLGGQILGLVPNVARVRAMLMVAAGTGYHLDHEPRVRRMVWWLWRVVVPLTIPLFGYFPGRRLRMVGDIPAGAMLQWRRWCLNPEYLLGVEGPEVRARYDALRLPIRSLSFADDELMSARNIERLCAAYSGTEAERVVVEPMREGLRRVGHFGFFKRALGEQLWADAARWLEEQAGA